MKFREQFYVHKYVLDRDKKRAQQKPVPFDRIAIIFISRLLDIAKSILIPTYTVSDGGVIR